MKRAPLITALLTAVAIGQVRAQSAQIGPEVMVTGGVVRAIARDERGVLSFKGIPYAAAPIGALRWHAPEPVQAWTGVRAATQFGSRCLSAWKRDFTPGPPFSEDCLTLNVWTAATRPDEKRPVMVWIHGGGFEFGSSADFSTDGTRLAKKGVVLVSLNYRVGVLGFLAHPELDRDGPSGNYGLQDQLAALRWVKSNIARFGGDPNNVTVFGESAGAHAIGILMSSPLAVGLMDKAIGQSGAFWDSEYGPLASFDEARARGVAFVRDMHVASIAALRALPAERVNASATWDFSTHPGVTAFSPSIDGYVVTAVPATRFVRGEQLHIPLLAGWNEVEQLPFRALALPHKTAADFRTAAEHLFGKEKMAEFLKYYPADSDEQAKASADALTGDLVISEQTWQWLELQQRLKGTPVYGYKFTYTSAYVPVASHLTDVPFVFGTLTPQFIVGGREPPGAADRALSETIMSYWTNFAAHGDPNGDGLPHWPAYEGQGVLQYLALEVGPRKDAQVARLRFLASFRVNGALPAAWRTLAR